MSYMIIQGPLGLRLPKGHVRPQAESGWPSGCQAGTETELEEFDIIKPTSDPQHRPVPVANVSQMDNVRLKRMSP